jgi:integrase
MEWSLRRYFTWRKPLDKITHEDVAQVLDAIAAPSERAHAFSYIRMFFNWCIPRYLSTNPTHGYTVQASPPGSRVLTDDELKRVWVAADDTTPFGCIVRLCILTGQRRGELSNVQPSWVAEQSLTIPSTATKNKRQHSIPCGPIAIELLKKSSFSFNSWSKGLARLHKRSETSDWSLHDLRRTFATNLAALNVPIHVTEKLLNHVSGTTGGLVGVYQRHQYWDEQVAAIAAWEKRLQEIVGR